MNHRHRSYYKLVETVIQNPLVRYNANWISYHYHDMVVNKCEEQVMGLHSIIYTTTKILDNNDSVLICIKYKKIFSSTSILYTKQLQLEQRWRKH